MSKARASAVGKRGGIFWSSVRQAPQSCRSEKQSKMSRVDALQTSIRWLMGRLQVNLQPGDVLDRGDRGRLQPFLADVAADSRSQDALKQYQAEKSQAAQEVTAYLDGFDSY